MIKYLHWDSKFFDKVIGKLTLTSDQLPKLETNNYDVLYVYQSEDFQIEIPNFIESFKDTKLVFQKKIGTTGSSIPDEIKSIKNVGDHKDKLYELVYLNGIYSRFNLDENFDDADFRSLYRIWMDKSIKLEMADDIFVYLKNDEVIGFVSFTTNELCTKLRLMAIDPNHRGMGVASKLMDAVEQHVKKKGIKYIQIPTQWSNQSACNLYVKNGFQIIHKEIIKHYWRNDSI